MRTVVRPAVFALLSIAPAIALLDPAIWHFRLDTGRLELALVLAAVGAGMAIAITPAGRRVVEVNALLAMMIAVPAAAAFTMHAVCNGRLTAVAPLDVTWLIGSGATYVCGSTLILAARRLGFPWWPVALVVALAVAYGLVDAQAPCFFDE
jgi:hypothetical protein